MDEPPESEITPPAMYWSRTPEDIAKVARSYTGKLLKELVAARKVRAAG